ncbi:MAG: hypothetical protein Q8R18_03035 [bacterium]|nr:hypothetical protein [bacterium]
MDKKAAVELSMTTIIIIVIGITILSLGLVWIRSVFSDVGELTSGAFEQGETQIAEIFGGTDQPVALSPSETKMSQGETTTATLAINNLGSIQVSGVYAEVEAKAFGGAATDTLVCAFSDTLSGKTNTYSLNSGKGISGLKVLVEDQGSNLGTYACVITVYNLPDGTETTSLIINIES